MRTVLKGDLSEKLCRYETTLQRQLSSLLRELSAFFKERLNYVPRKVDEDCLRELRCFYDRATGGDKVLEPLVFETYKI